MRRAPDSDMLGTVAAGAYDGIGEVRRWPS